MPTEICAANPRRTPPRQPSFSRFSLGFAALCAASSVAGCAASREAPPAPASQAASPLGAGSPATVASTADATKAASPTRKIVRQAELELEVTTPSSAQTAIERLAEQHGGYVVSAARDTDHDTSVDVRVNLVVRVPAAELTQTIAEVKKLGRGTGSERITSDDVTDEYIDLGARIASQKQLEQQYLEILKRATTVKDAMDVQKELAEVRTEIERLQGRAQLLDKESAYSTLTVHLTTAVPQIAVSTTTFGGTLRRAWSDAVGESADIAYGVIRAFGFLAPILLLLGVPSAFGIWLMLRIARYFAARSRKLQAAALNAAA
ncbi:MAG TPA: DUF4349 domain-containing protein [Polyangiaceae bacterium]|jgi:hypothetical protein|nr:DUF4349 domain-containing protein [Polyangiaceae bacterium]